jgi:Ca-activated chloride channel family protein
MRHPLLAHRWMLPLLFCLAGTVVRPVDAQEVREAQSPTVPRYQTRIDLVAVNVTVLDRSHRLVGGLPPERFEVFEDGVRQDISYFENRDVPLDVVLLIDTSSSMYNKLRAIRLASAAFARALRPGDRGAVLTFNSRVTQGVPLTAEAHVLDTAIRSIQAGGGTSLYDSIYIALRTLSSGTYLYSAGEAGNGGSNGSGGAGPQENRIRRQAIVVLTDGTDTTSLMTFEMLQEEARRANVMIYGICLLGAPVSGDAAAWEDRLDVNMRELSRDTGGLAFTVKTDSELAAAYDRVTSELMHQYLLAYSPKPKRAAPPSSGFRRIVIQLRDVPDATVRARAGYLWTPHTTAARRSGVIK